MAKSFKDLLDKTSNEKTRSIAQKRTEELLKEINNNENIKQYYLDKDQKIDIRVDHWSHGRLHVSIYNDRNDSCIGFTCYKDEFKGLADFIYEVMGKK